jgi:hypothetical protein
VARGIGTAVRRENLPEGEEGGECSAARLVSVSQAEKGAAHLFWKQIS